MNKRIIAIEHDLQVFGSNPRFSTMVAGLKKELATLKREANNERVERSLNSGVKIGSLIQFKGLVK